MLQASVLKTIAIWQICLIGAVLMIMFGVLKPGEASSSIPLSMLFLVVGALATSGALSATGAGELIGSIISKAVVNQASLIKGGWLYAIVSCIISVGWIMTAPLIMCLAKPDHI